jgi:hypothetical protein
MEGLRSGVGRSNFKNGLEYVIMISGTRLANFEI